MKPTLKFVKEFHERLYSVMCPRCHKHTTRGKLFCVDCLDEIEQFATMRDTQQIDKELPDGMHVVTRRGLAQQNRVNKV